MQSGTGKKGFLTVSFENRGVMGRKVIEIAHEVDVCIIKLRIVKIFLMETWVS